MATFIRGKPGLLEELTTQRDRLENRLRSDGQNIQAARMTKTARAKTEAEIGVYNSLIGWLDNATLLTEQEYDQVVSRFETTTGGKPTVREETPA
jgi:hypothetical protein